MKSNLLYFPENERMAQMAEMQVPNVRPGIAETPLKALAKIAVAILSGYAFLGLLFVLAYLVRLFGGRVRSPF